MIPGSSSVKLGFSRPYLLARTTASIKVKGRSMTRQSMLNKDAVYFMIKKAD